MARSCSTSLCKGQILDAWHSNGLRGTGSHDYAVNNVFVPATRVINLLFRDCGLKRCDTQTYAMPTKSKPAKWSKDGTTSTSRTTS